VPLVASVVRVVSLTSSLQAYTDDSVHESPWLAFAKDHMMVSVQVTASAARRLLVVVDDLVCHCEQFTAGTPQLSGLVEVAVATIPQ
jgi:hypothetical protein